MYIKGVGMTKFGVSDKLSHQLAHEAALEALHDADLKFAQIDAIVCSSIEWFFSIEKQRHFASMLASVFSTNKPIIRVPAACGSSGAGFWFAQQQEFDHVLVIGAEKHMTCKTESITEEFMMAAESKWEQDEGLNFPAQNALIAQEYMSAYPQSTTEHLAKIALKNHDNAFLNPKARFYQKKVTLEQIRDSPMVCSPLRMFDCSVSVDGAAAAVLSKDKTDIRVAGSDLCTDYISPFERDSNTSWDATVEAAKNAYAMAGIEPCDVDVAELHDAFTIVELIASEDLGFAKKGHACNAIDDGAFCLDGKLPINPSGGLKAKGHPISATGLAQIYELTKQLRGEAGDRQVANPKTALAQNIGGAGGTGSVHVLRKG